MNTKESIPEIQDCLKEIRNSIDSRYAPYLHKNKDGTYPMCPNIHDYLSDVKAIIKNLEILLNNAYYSRGKKRGETRTITQNAALNNELFYFLQGKAYNSPTYKNIEKTLDKHFFTMFEPLYDD